MKGKVYDITKLSESNEIDMELVRLFFFNNQDYFNGLTEFLFEYQQYLGHYTPAFVINSPEDKGLFLAECFKVRASLMRLGLRLALEELDYMEDAIYAENVKAFSDGQVKFEAAIQIYKRLFKAVQL